jgi:hypothetical protein
MRAGKWSDWLHVLGNFAIVIGLVLVLLQMRQNEALQRVEILNQYADTYAVIESSFAGERLPEIWEKSIREPQNLTLAETRMLEAQTWAPVLRWINLYRQAEAGILSDEDWRKEVRNDAGFYFGTPYAQAWWERAGAFSLQSGFLPEEIYQIVQERIDNPPEGMNPLTDYEFIMDRLRQQAPAADVDLSGQWEIQSSVGGDIPITVRCILEQHDTELSGTCTPEMEDAEASELVGTVDGNTAVWGYDVVFNEQPGTVEFRAETITTTGMLGVLSLSGTRSSFAALKR